MAKDPLIIEAPRQGIAPSPNVGFGDCRNLDLDSTPGIAKLNNLMAKKSATTVDAFVKWIVRDPDTPANVFALDSNGVLYKSANSGATWTEVSDRAGSGQGLAVKWGYVFVCTATTIDVMKISDSSWTTGWQTIESDSLWHPMHVSRNDGKIYGGAGRYIFSIEELTTFVPGTSATFDFTAQALDLPKNYRVKCLEEFGNNLMCGTWMGTTITDFRIADVFPWDRSNPSFNQPIAMSENGVNAMKVKDNRFYILAGVEGRVYRSDGYSATPVAEIPPHIIDLKAGKYVEFNPGAIETYKGRLFFGLSGSGATGGCGVYSIIETSSGTVLNFEHQISTGEIGDNDIVKIGALLGISRDELLVSWQDDENSSYGIDKTTNSSFATGYTGYFDSPLYRVGTFLNKVQYQSVQLQLSKKLATNEGIKLYWRINDTDAFTVFPQTYDFATLGAVISHKIDSPIPQCELVEIRVELTGTTTTPYFKNLILS